MMLDRHFFTRVVPDVLWGTSTEPVFNAFTYDSRLVKPGSTFCALAGERVDGHDFILDALQRGAQGLVISKAKQHILEVIDKKLLLQITVAVVPHVEEALIALATAWREQFSFPVVGITGSIGKTTTKELLAAMVQLHGKNYVVTQGNNNTAVSIATTLLALRPEHEGALIEMGINKRGEMARLAAIVKPTLAVITTVAHSHMEGLGSIVDIAAEKRAIFKYFKEDNIGIIHGDQPLLANIAYHHPVVKFGYKIINQVQARKVAIHGSAIHCTIKLYNERYPVVLPTVHTGRLTNALASAAVACFLSIPAPIIMRAIQQEGPVTGRFQPCPLRAKKGLVIHDCYNANPESMKEALLAFERLENSGKKIAVLGDMLELGVNTHFWHRHLGRLLRKMPSLQHVILVGKYVKAAEKTMPRDLSYTLVADWQEAIVAVEGCLEEDMAILVKASNGVGLKNLVESIAVL